MDIIEDYRGTGGIRNTPGYLDKSEKEVWKYYLLFTGLLNKIWEFYSGCVYRVKGFMTSYDNNIYSSILTIKNNLAMVFISLANKANPHQLLVKHFPWRSIFRVLSRAPHLHYKTQKTPFQKSYFITTMSRPFNQHLFKCNTFISKHLKNIYIYETWPT